MISVTLLHVLLLLEAISYLIMWVSLLFFRHMLLDYVLYGSDFCFLFISACLQIGTGGIYEGTNSMDTHRFL